MASEQNTPESNDSNQSVLSLLAMMGGFGIFMIVVAAGTGVVWENADSGLIGLFAMIGAGLLIAAIGGWVINVKPYENFDDISVPMYHGHHHDDHADDEH